MKDDHLTPLLGLNEKKLILNSVYKIGSFSKNFIHKWVGQPIETKVAGKKVIVTTVIAFIAEASLFTSSPIRTWILLSPWAAVLKACCRKLENLI